MNSFDMKLTQKLVKEYKNSNKVKKNLILDNYCKLTRVSRNTAVQRFRRIGRKPYPRALPVTPNKRGRKKKFDQIHVNLIRKCWELSDEICAERLYPQLPFLVEQLEKSNLLNDFSQEIVSQTLSISEGSLKNIIAKFPKPTYRQKRKGNVSIYKYVPTKPNFGQYSNIPGNVEVDYVEHHDGSGGPFAITGCYNCIFSGWIARTASLGKSENSVEFIHKNNEKKFLHNILEYHPDNAQPILKLLLQNAITKENPNGLYLLSRSRPYKKNDNAHVEQKNGDKVRRLVGYRRYYTKEHVTMLNKLYAISDLYDNFFIPSSKLEEVVKDDLGRVIKRKHDIAKTPYQRLLESEEVSEEIKRKLKEIYDNLNMVVLKNKRDKLQDALTNIVFD